MDFELFIVLAFVVLFAFILLLFIIGAGKEE